MNYINSLINQHQMPSLQEIHNNGGHIDTTSSQEDFLEQLMASHVPSSFPWPDDLPFHSANPANDDESVKFLFNDFTGSLGQTSNQPHHFHQSQAENYGPPAPPPPAVSQTAASGGQGRQRARRGQATDPHSIAERLRRERIAERMKGLQELVPNANKTDKASMLDEIIDYVKFLQLQVKVLSMSRLSGASAVTPLAPDMSSEGRNGSGTQTASSSNNNDGMTVTKNQVAKLLQEDMGSAMQYLQGKGLCLMPISLATAISTSTSRPNNTLLNGGPNSPNVSLLTAQSATIIRAHKDSTSISKP